MNIWVFSVAAILSLPKQFITVYIGVILEQEGTGTYTNYFPFYITVAKLSPFSFGHFRLDGHKEQDYRIHGLSFLCVGS